MIILIALAILILSIVILFNISIKLEVYNLKITLPTNNKKIINNESKILLKIYILNKIKIAEINLKNIENNNKFIKKIDKFKSNVKIGFNKDIFKINYKIEDLNIKIFIGLEDAAITSISVGIISTLIGIILRNSIKDLEKNKFEVIPIYKNTNILKIEFEGTFEFSIRDIKNIVKFLKKGRVNKNVRTSNRRTYAYSNE